MAHQVIAAQRLAEAPEHFALGAEQGTGKTFMCLNDAEQRWLAKDIEALFVLAPKGVHTNWTLREIPKLLEVPHVADFWTSGGGIRHKRRIAADILGADPREGLVILTMNIDSIKTASGLKLAQMFMAQFRTMMFVDESHRIKTHNGMLNKRARLIGTAAVSLRIGSGTLVPNRPFDVFGQYQFLKNGLLGTTSYRTFVAEYSELLPEEHPMIEAINAKSRYKVEPQIPRTDASGKPVYRNLHKLRALMEPWTYRVLKKDCLDLPEKIYRTADFDLPPPLRRAYDELQDNRRHFTEDGGLEIFTPLSIITKLRQATSGFIKTRTGSDEFSGCKPREELLVELLKDVDFPVIIWASFNEEIERVHALLSPKLRVARYQGATPDDEREAAVDEFQAGALDIFLSNPKAGGTGITLTAARTVIYYSSDYSLVERLQSEDRSHRIGTLHPIVYIDMVARNTINERIAALLQQKEEVAAELLAFGE